MGIWSGTKKTAGFIFNVRVDQWMDIRYLKEVLVLIVSFAKGIFIPTKPEIEETFDEAIDRLQITEEDLKKRKKEFAKLVIIYLLFSLSLFVYALYLSIYKSNWTGTAITFTLVIYTLINAFKYHFWLYQINNRKLGCSVRDWLNSKSKQE